MKSTKFLGAVVPIVCASNNSLPCTASTFSSLTIPGTSILNVSTSPIANFSAPDTVDTGSNHYPEAVSNLNACEVNITYTHPGQGDSINVVVWLTTTWNGRLLGIGGGGWSAGDYSALAWPASKGYAAVTTDGGHIPAAEGNTWALKSKGNVDWSLLQDFASIALDDAASIGKEVSRLFYGELPKKSYFSGCSTGGRQGYMMAQRYPEQYDGILATAPGINWDRVIPGIHYAQKIMDWLGTYPPLCELDGFTAAAVAACDEQDGVKDGIVSDPWNCDFEPETVVGQPYTCASGPKGTLTAEGAAVAKKIAAPITFSDGGLLNGRPVSYGVFATTSLLAVANTTCTSSSKATELSCVGRPFLTPEEYVKLYILKDASSELTTLTPREWDTVFRQSINQYSSIIGTSDADLTDFKDAGGKLLSWHGLGDQALPANNTIEYWERVKERDEEVDDYYRLFTAPGVGHCSPGLGIGWFPGSGLDALVKWVEDGVAPERLEAHTVAQEKERAIGLCKWPERVVFKGGDANAAESFGCEI